MKDIKEITGLTKCEFYEFYKDAKNLVLDNHTPADNRTPIALLTGGQPGAGKSGIVIKSRLDFQKIGVNPVILDGDTYRGLYPNAKQIANEQPDKYADITDKATGKVMGLLIEDSILGGYDFIREGTLNSAEIVDQLIASPKCYKIIIRLLATCREESILSCFERYILMKEATGIGRFITLQSHDKRYIQFPKTAKEQEKKGVQIEVYERGNIINNPILLYDNKHFNSNFNSFEEALKFGRKHSFEQCKNNIANRIAEIERRLNKMNTNESSILRQLEQFKTELKLKESEMER